MWYKLQPVILDGIPDLASLFESIRRTKQKLFYVSIIRKDNVISDAVKLYR